MFTHTTSKFDTRLNNLLMLMFLGIFGLALHGSAASPPPPPSYSVTVKGGLFSPNLIYGVSNGMTATAAVTGTLNVQNSSTEIQESGDRWGWTANVTGYAPSSTASYVAVPSGITMPKVVPSQGSATSNVTATADQTTSPGYYRVTVTGTDSFNLTDSSTDPATVTSTSRSGQTTLYITVGTPTVTITIDDHVQNGHSITGTIALSSPTSLPGSIVVGLSALNTPAPSPQTTPPTPAATGMVSLSSGVTVPGDGTPANFTATGTAASAFLNDVYIKATNGASSNSVYLTVWSPGPAVCTATPHDPYYITNDGSTVSLSSSPSLDAVDLRASAGITPSVAPLAWLASAYPPGAQVGLIQNIVNGATYVVAYNNPTITWNASVPKGTKGYAYTGWTDTITVPTCVDTDDNSTYPRPYDPLVPITQLWASSDDPSINGMPTVVTKPLLAADYQTKLGIASYRIQRLSISASFVDWCCIVINSSTTFPATAGWSVNFTGTPPSVAGTTLLGPIVSGGGGSGSPITTGYDANQYLANILGINPPVETPSPPVRLSFTK